MRPLLASSGAILVGLALLYKTLRPEPIQPDPSRVAAIYRETKDPWKVEKEALAALRAHPDNAEVLYYLAWAKYELAFPQEGANFLTRARTLSPHNPLVIK